MEMSDQNSPGDGDMCGSQCARPEDGGMRGQPVDMWRCVAVAPVCEQNQLVVTVTVQHF